MEKHNYRYTAHVSDDTAILVVYCELHVGKGMHIT